MGVAEKYYFSNALRVGVTLMRKYFSKMKASLLGNYFHFLSFYMYVTFITSSRRWIRKWLNRERRISSLVIPKTNKSQSTPAGSSFNCCNCFLELLDALALQHNNFVFNWPRDASSMNMYNVDILVIWVQIWTSYGRTFASQKWSSAPGSLLGR